MAGVCDYRERRTRLLFTIFRFCFSGRFLGRRRRRRTRRKLLAQREQRFSSSSKHCVWYLTFFLTLKKGLPFLCLDLSFFATWQKKRRERKMTIYYACVCLLHANAMMMMVTRWCVVRFAFLCSSFRIISPSSSSHRVCVSGSGRVF